MNCQVSVDTYDTAYVEKFEKEQYVCYIKTGEMAQVVSVHLADIGKH
jgi:hypothetical protein